MYKRQNVDRLYELIDDVDNGYYNNNNNNLYVYNNDVCYKYVRYLHDDGGWIKKSGYGHF